MMGGKKKRVLITGGSGWVGKFLINKMIKAGFEVSVLSRKRRKMDGMKLWLWNEIEEFIEEGALIDQDVIIHLAGEGVLDKKWTEERKKRIIDSRVKTAKLLHDKIRQLDRKPELFISASGISAYGTITSDEVFREDLNFGTDFLAECVYKWEKVTLENSSVNRNVLFRIGVVLGPNGGALSQIDATIRKNIGAPLGSGKQWVPWVHVEDLCSMILHSIQQPKVEGVYNAVAPVGVTNKELTKAIATALNKKLWLPNVPGFVLRLILGERADLVLKGSRGSIEKIEASGFNFKFSKIQEALHQIYQNS